ncbi:uncharacterized protein LOC134528283 isoform X2 [Bacillus rossius redtenbacheri]|uniref:uncharacterized protein LOC134528283 isoform X2 n=1 Tax=Bacillus rossius redtenbacheri TaxID=93214 RepID=UPI002FDCBCB5
MAEGSQRGDDEFGFVRRDSGVLERAVQGEGLRGAGSAGGPPPPEQEAAASGPADKGRRAVAPAPAAGTTRSTVSKATSLLKRMSASQQPKEDDQLPQSFQVKYLGSRDARGLWGIKHTRRPVDALVAAAKDLPPGAVLPLVRLTVSRDGVSLGPLGAGGGGGGGARTHAIDTISYGVQDLVYTRVFSMIVVREASAERKQHPFECHAFVCESRSSARRLTYALAAAFNEYSKVVKAGGGGSAASSSAAAAAVRRKFAIDLRTPEEIEAELNSSERPDVDSEA